MSEGVLPDVGRAQRLPLETAALRSLPSSDGARVVAFLGRAVLVWFSLLVVYGSSRAVSQRDLLAVSIAAILWLSGLRAAAALRSAFVSSFAISAIGALLGATAVRFVDGSSLGLDVADGEIALLALAVFSSAAAWEWVVDHTAAGRRRVLLVGSSAIDADFVEELSRRRHPTFEVLGAIAGCSELATVVDSQRPDLVVLTDEAAYEQELERLLDAATNVSVTDFASFVEQALGRIPIDHITSGRIFSLQHPRRHVCSRIAERAFDVVVAAAALALLAPLLVCLALLTRATKGPVLYRQTRVGVGGRPFTIYKLRTMCCGAEDGGPTFCVDGDVRVTGLGAFLRRTHLDELPQLWNVLKGDMSIVGPRPERPEFMDALVRDIPFWTRRLLVKPGITGWAQVRDGYACDSDGMRRKLSYDLWYLRHRGLIVDVAVCALTVSTVLRRIRS
jgi:exopolysaccharide biosynthesis polyprenyl glycosylphosphotransferase